MPSAPTLVAFAGASLLLILMPGPAMLFLLAQGAAGGRRAGVVAALGVQTAMATFVLATALGLTAVLAASSAALTVVRYAGAAYLVCLGIGVLRSRRAANVAVDAVPVVARRSDWAQWRQGYLVGIANPKVVLFFLAFFPQFLDPARGPVSTQVLALGVVFVAIGSVCDTVYGALAGVLSARLARRPGRPGRPGRGRIAVGLTYIGLGGFTAVTGSRTL